MVKYITCVYIYIYMRYMYYVYIDIDRERERETYMFIHVRSAKQMRRIVSTGAIHFSYFKA